MLKRAFPLAALLGLAATARAQEEQSPDGIRVPQRLTAGVADQLLGQLAPDGKTLTYLSTAEASSDVYAMDLSTGRAHRLFDDGAEATWPRVSPDGRSLLYISYRDQAQGQLCVRDFPSTERRRCLADPGALQAEWLGPSRIALVQRSSIQGDLQLLEVTVDSELSSHPLLSRSATSPAPTPDGRWLAYIPIEREAQAVGEGFAARTAAKLELVRLDAPTAPHLFGLHLPGLTAQPTFSRDGRWLYFVQFLADTNGDGAIDAADHGVLFRVPFDPGSADPAAELAKALPEQLTDETSNCQYPQAASDRLLATCSLDDSLDIFELPLTGALPEDWTNERLGLELELSTQTAEQLLLERRLALLQPSALGYLPLVRLHVQRAEFETARAYATEVERADAAETQGLGRNLLAWVDQRRQGWDRERGREVDGFAKNSRERLTQLAPKPGDSPVAVALGHLARSDIASALGDFALARAELEATQLPEHAPRTLLELAYERGESLYRVLDEREPFLALSRRLALRPGPVDVQLRFARAYVRALQRGLPPKDAEAALAQEAAQAPAGSELGFAVELASAVRLIADEHSVPAREVLVALFARETRPDRRHALMTDAVARASELGVDRVTETLAQKYVEDVKPGTAERRRAELLYRHALLGRAYRRRSKAEYPKALEDFEAVVKHTHSLEALVAALDLRLRAGEKVPALIASVEQGDQPDWVKHFGHAYLLSHGMRDLAGDPHRRAVDEATALLRSSWSELRGQRMARALRGAIDHEAFLATGSLDEAEKAATHYAVALKGIHTNLRLSAMLLGELGLLHTSVGNYRLALGSLDRREKLPYFDNSAGLAVRLARARALLHTGKEAEAATVADEAVAMTNDPKAPKLAHFRLLALDRAALYNLAARRFAQALTWYDAELRLLPQGSLRNPVALRLARAAAALGAKHPERALEDLATVKAALGHKEIGAALASAHVTEEEAARNAELLANGLEANALLALGRGPEAAQALETREQLFTAQLALTHRDADEGSITLVQDRLAARAAADGDEGAATSWAQKALGHADAFGKLNGTTLGFEQADALWLAGELAAFGGPAGDVRERLEAALDVLARREGKAWVKYRRWFELCLGLLDVGEKR